MPTEPEAAETREESTPVPAPTKSPKQDRFEKLKAEYDIVEPPETPPVPVAKQPEPEPAPGPAPAATPSAGTGAPKLPPYLVRQAKEFDISDEEIADHTEKSLERAVNREIRRTRELAARPHVQTPAISNIGKPEPQNDEPPKLDWGNVVDEVTGEERPAEEKDFQTPFVGIVKKLNDEIHALKAQVKVLGEREAHRARQQQASWLDQRFQTRPEVFGTWTVDQLTDRTSPEYVRRHSVLSTMEALAKMDTQMGRSRTHEELFDSAVSALFGGTAPAPKTAPKVGRDPETGKFTPAPTVTDEEAEELEARKEAFAKGGIPKPTDRTPPKPKKGVQLATQTAAKFLDELRNGDIHGDDETPEI